jgi:hypothetical protein
MDVLQSKFNLPLRENEKVYIKWNNLNYYVPELKSYAREGSVR